MSQHVQGVPQPLLVLVTGKPGSGKSTLAIELGRAHNLGLPMDRALLVLLLRRQHSTGAKTMSDSFNTLASWHILEGQADEFLRVWKEELASAFLHINPTTHGTLIQSLENPRQFYSFGP